MYADANILFDLDTQLSFMDPALKGIYESTLIDHDSSQLATNLKGVPVQVSIPASLEKTLCVGGYFHKQKSFPFFLSRSESGANQYKSQLSFWAVILVPFSPRGVQTSAVAGQNWGRRRLSSTMALAANGTPSLRARRRRQLHRVPRERSLVVGHQAGERRRCYERRQAQNLLRNRLGIPSTAPPFIFRDDCVQSFDAWRQGRVSGSAAAQSPSKDVYFRQCQPKGRPCAYPQCEVGRAHNLVHT